MLWLTFYWTTLYLSAYQTEYAQLSAVTVWIQNYGTLYLKLHKFSVLN